MMWNSSSTIPFLHHATMRDHWYIIIAVLYNSSLEQFLSPSISLYIHTYIYIYMNLFPKKCSLPSCHAQKEISQKLKFPLKAVCIWRLNIYNLFM